VQLLPAIAISILLALSNISSVGAESTTMNEKKKWMLTSVLATQPVVGQKQKGQSSTVAKTPCYPPAHILQGSIPAKCEHQQISNQLNYTI